MENDSQIEEIVQRKGHSTVNTGCKTGKNYHIIMFYEPLLITLFNKVIRNIADEKAISVRA